MPLTRKISPVCPSLNLAIRIFSSKLIRKRVTFVPWPCHILSCKADSTAVVLVCSVAVKTIYFLHVDICSLTLYVKLTEFFGSGLQKEETPVCGEF